MSYQNYQKIICNSNVAQIPSLLQGFNRRWFAHNCEAIYLCFNTDGVVEALEEAISLYGQNVKIKGGGHCYEDFVFGNSTLAIIDISPMNEVGLDPYRGFYLGSGGTNWSSFEKLFRDYGKVLPGGSCYSVGLGGHISGGGYGLLSRKHGLTVDWLSGVEIVVKDRADQPAYAIYVSSESTDDEGDLYWSQRGGGGGNFGVITRYYFRDLPQAPQKAYISSYGFPWAELDKEKLRDLLKWFADFSSQKDNCNQFGLFALNHFANEEIQLTIQTVFDEEERDKAQDQIDKQGKALKEIITKCKLGQGSRLRPATRPMYGHGSYFLPQVATVWRQNKDNLPCTTEYTFYEAVQNLNSSGPNRRGKYKSAYMRKPFPDEQVDTIFEHLRLNPFNDSPGDMQASLLQVDTYGGEVNKMATDATAVAHRSSILKLQYQTYWTSKENDDFHLKWIRNFYKEMYRAYDGTPDPEKDPTQNVNGCYYSYPDVDLNDAVGLRGAMQLYFLDNFERLTRTKKRWDPNNFFNHTQSIPLEY